MSPDLLPCVGRRGAGCRGRRPRGGAGLSRPTLPNSFVCAVWRGPRDRRGGGDGASSAVGCRPGRPCSRLLRVSGPPSWWARRVPSGWARASGARSTSVPSSPTAGAAYRCRRRTRAGPSEADSAALEGGIEGDRAHRARLSSAGASRAGDRRHLDRVEGGARSVEQETARRLRRARPRPDVDALDVVLAAAHGGGRPCWPSES